ncbi:MAG: DUF3943 domain-containing protein [Woeseiaceae bacterium]|nr:DUF3943 domain-containing protein [Woeseiaceae bacterium]
MLLRPGIRWLGCAVLAFLVMASGDARARDSDHTDFQLQPYSESDEVDREGLRRDTWYFLGYQWVTIGILYLAPESVSSWSDEQKEGYDMSYWWDNVTNPQIDSDKFYLNYVLHPYWGASYYVRARERGYGAKQAFWYSAMLSTIYEYGAEALFEEPSIQDLIVTPVFGSLLGAYFMNVRDGILIREQELGFRTTKDKWAWVLTDPLGSLNNQVDKMFGRETHLQLLPYRQVARRHHQWPGNVTTTDKDVVYGVGFSLQF